MPDRVSAGTTRDHNHETTVSINDDDHPVLTVNFGAGAYSVEESDDTSTGDKQENEVTVTVTLSAAPEREVTIPIQRTNQGASDSDYSGVPTSVTVGATETEQTFTFTAEHDTEDDDDESVKLSFGGPLPDRVSAGTTHETTVSINDDDHPVLTVNFGAGAYSVEESDDTSTGDKQENEVTVMVTLSAAPEREVTIPIQRTNQGASDSDYSGVPTSVTVGATETEQTFTFTAEHDTEDDDDESVKLSFGGPLPDRVSAGTTHETTVSINDDDVPAVEVSFELATYTVPEGSGFTVKVKLNAAPERTVDITLILTNQGASDSDYSGVPTSVTFGPTETEQTFTFTAADDAEDDDDESVEISFDSPLPDGVSAGIIDETTVSITDNDTANLVLNLTSLTVDEAGSGTFTVKLATQPSGSVTVAVSSDDTGAATASPASLTFTTTDWNATQEVTVSGVNDSDAAAESVMVSLSASGGGYAGKTGSVSVSVTDDDTADLVVTPSTLTVDEAGSGTFTVKLATQPSGSVTVGVSSDDTGAATASPASLTFTTTDWNATQDGDGKRCERLGRRRRERHGVAERVGRRLRRQDRLGERQRDRRRHGDLVVTPSTLTVDEAGSGTFTVKLATQPSANVTVGVTSDDTGAATASPASLTFTTADWDTTQTVTVSGVNDSDAGAESVMVSLSASGGDYAGKTGSVSVSVTDDDTANLVVTPSTLTVDEAGSGTFTVKLATQPSGSVTVGVSSDDTGAATASPASLTFTTDTTRLERDTGGDGQRGGRLGPAR